MPLAPLLLAAALLAPHVPTTAALFQGRFPVRISGGGFRAFSGHGHRLGGAPHSHHHAEHGHHHAEHGHQSHHAEPNRPASQDHAAHAGGPAPTAPGAHNGHVYIPPVAQGYGPSAQLNSAGSTMSYGGGDLMHSMATAAIISGAMHHHGHGHHHTGPFGFQKPGKACGQNVIICNAYASKEPLTVVAIRAGQRGNGSRPLPYKECKTIHARLNSSDTAEFWHGDMRVGGFRFTNLKDGANMVLIANRAGPNSRAAAFMSHVFNNMPGAEAVVLDAYHGAQLGAVQLKDGHRTLKFNSSAQIRPGKHQLNLVSGDGKTSMAVAFRVSQDTDLSKYLLMRVGHEGGANGTNDTNGNLTFPQEFVTLRMPHTMSSCQALIRKQSKQDLTKVEDVRSAAGPLAARSALVVVAAACAHSAMGLAHATF